MLLDLYRGKELAREGADHLNYVIRMKDTEYELTYSLGDTEQETKYNSDEALHQAMMEDLRIHKLTCGGCSSKTLNLAKKLVKKLQT